MIFQDISTQIQDGNAKKAVVLVEQAIGQGICAQDILEKGLIDGMNVVGELFKRNEIFVADMLYSARAMQKSTEVLRPLLVTEGVEPVGKACIGTVQGDLHDIGKNLVKMMLEGKGIEVIDLGTDVAPETFIKTAVEENCGVICCSALLTTTMPSMKDVVEAAKAAGIRDRVKIMIGGAPTNEAFCREIGADAHTVDAASAAEQALAYLQ
ncbi:MAG: corrinoid protein [Oscillospiraceae bacterium]|nr:corrinoid protein [Oscillospiraceae bacterium]